MATDYFRLRLIDVPAQFEDELVSYLFEEGAEGSSEVLDWVQPELEYAPLTQPKELRVIDFYFRSSLGEDWLSRLTQFLKDANQVQSSDIRFDVIKEVEKDWLEEWKKGFTAFEFVPGTWIVPSWESPPHEAQSWIRMDPGLAFGTGTHETTQLAGSLLVKRAGLSTDLAQKSLIDVGTGTGVLATLARRLGVQSIAAVDNDPESFRVASENFQLNEVQEIDLSLKELKGFPTGSFDFVLANIIEGILLELNMELNRILKPGGVLIFSGLLASQEQSFRKNYQLPLGYGWAETLTQGQWIGIEAAPAESLP